MEQGREFQAENGMDSLWSTWIYLSTKVNIQLLLPLELPVSVHNLLAYQCQAALTDIPDWVFKVSSGSSVLEDLQTSDITFIIECHLIFSR